MLELDDPGSEDGGLDERLADAARLAAEGEQERALEVLLELEKDHTEDAVLLAMVGTLAAELGAAGIAADFFRRCLDQHPTDPHVLVAAGAGLAASHDPAAEPALRLAALTAPDLPAARLHFGSYLARIGLLDQAIEELAVARGLDRDDPRIGRELGVAYIQKGQIPAAIAEFEAALESDPGEAGDDELRVLLGLVLIDAGETDRAAEDLYPLAEFLSSDAELQLLLALLFARVGWEEEAWLALSRAEGATTPADPAMVQEVEDALEAGEEAVRSLLHDEFAPALLRARLHPG
jgi:tetratricopeptide (TPR) repeat protein